MREWLIAQAAKLAEAAGAVLVVEEKEPRAGTGVRLLAATPVDGAPDRVLTMRPS